MLKLRLFILSFLITAVAVLVYAYATRPPARQARLPKLVPLSDSLYITSQLSPENLPALAHGQLTTLVDIRPDGEDPAQPSSAEMAAAARENSISFHYIPVPHESFPEEAVEGLRAVLDAKDGSAVLYCRSGRRAARLYALAEARRPAGAEADEIIKTVSNAGFTADDLRARIEQDVSNRGTAPIPPP